MPPKKDSKKSDKPVAKKKEGSGGGKAKKKVRIGLITNGSELICHYKHLTCDSAYITRILGTINLV